MIDLDTSIAEEKRLRPLEMEVIEFAELLTENMQNDPLNRQAYMQNATQEIAAYMPQAATILGLFDNFINPLRSHRRNRKNPVAQTVLPMLTVSKLLKELDENRR